MSKQNGRTRLRVAVSAMAAATVLMPTTRLAGQDRGPHEREAEIERRSPGVDFMRRAWSRMTEADREALFDAHLAAMHVGLKLTPEQDKLWPPLEAAMREAAAQTFARRRQQLNEGPPADPVAGLRRMAERARGTGVVLTKIADAAEPLYAALTPDQKRRLPILLHGIRPEVQWGLGRFAGPHAPAGQPPGWGLPE